MMLTLTPEEKENIQKLRMFVKNSKDYYISHCLDIYLTKQNGKTYLLFGKQLMNAEEEDKKVLEFVNDKTTFLNTAIPVVLTWDKVCSAMVSQELLQKDAGLANLFFQDLVPIVPRKTQYIAYYNLCRHSIAYRDSRAWRPIEHAYTDVTMESELSAARTSAVWSNFGDLFKWATTYSHRKISRKTWVLWSRYDTIKEHPLYTTRWFRIGSCERGTFEPGAIRPVGDDWEVAWAVRKGLCFSDEEKLLLEKYHQPAKI